MNGLGHLIDGLFRVAAAMLILIVLAIAAIIAWLWISERLIPALRGRVSLWRAGIIAGRWTRRADRLAAFYFPVPYDSDPDNEESL